MSHGLVTDAPVTRDQLVGLRAAPAHVIGAASAEGVAVLRLLLRLGFTDVTVHDMRPRAELRRALRTTHGAFTRTEQDALYEELRPVLDRGRYGEEYLTGVQDAALVSLGQGWYLVEENRARIVAAVPDSALVTSMSALYAGLHHGPIAGITGTNGKSTTVALVERLLRDGGVLHLTSGNERSSRQFLPEIEDVPAGTWALLETSNRQLLQLSSSPRVAAITALTPDHLEEHGGFDGYRDTKARLFERQAPDDLAIANADDPEALAVAARSPAAAAGRLVRCGTGDHPAPCVRWEGEELVARDLPAVSGGGDALPGRTVLAHRRDLHLPGAHNMRNAAVAAAMALACGVAAGSVAPSIDGFSGKSLRLELLDEVDGVEVWSDLKATTPEATIAALDALVERPGRVLLIAGGDDKGLDYAPLARAIQRGDVRTFAVPGSATDALALELDGLGSRALQRVPGLELALDEAFAAAASGDVVIVSPAAAGFWTRELQGGSSLRGLVRRRARVPQEVSES